MPKKAAPKRATSTAKITKNQTKTAVPTKSQTKTRTPRQKIDLSTASLDDIIASVNSKLGINAVRRAEEMETLYLLRRPTGITSLDIALAGGFPASSTIVFTAPDGAGKDYMLWLTAAEIQRIYGEDFCMCIYFTEFKADKPFMRDFCGLKVAFSDEELDTYDEARERIGLPKYTAEQRRERKTQIGNILIVDGVTAEKGFDAMMDMIASNRCQMCVINSIGSLQTEAKEGQESFEDFAQQSSEAMLISKFMPKLAMTLNNDRNGRNETTLFIVRQMRSKRDAQKIRGRVPQEKDKYEAGSKVWSLKHGMAIDLTMHRGTYHYDTVEQTKIGKVIKWEFAKGKLGTHEGITGEFDFFYDIGADRIGDLVKVCQQYGIFEGVGWIKYDDEEFGFNLQGAHKVRTFLKERPELIDRLREECFKRAELIYRHR